MKPTDEAIAAFMRGMDYEYVENDRWNNTYWLHSLNKDTIAPKAAAALYTAFRRGEVAALQSYCDYLVSIAQPENDSAKVSVDAVKEECEDRIAALRQEMEALK